MSEIEDYTLRYTMTVTPTFKEKIIDSSELSNNVNGIIHLHSINHIWSSVKLFQSKNGLAASMAMVSLNQME